ncbi:hypothetical protein PENTCL1PPCAC_20458, partial [Pristionchus entomophagus]
ILNFSMDILSLPTVFLHELMKHVDIIDRLRLRLTCRAFEQLVAESNARYIEKASIRFTEVSQSLKAFEINIGNVWVITHEYAEEEWERIRNRFFHKISFGDLVVNSDGSELALDFIQRFTHNFETKQLRFDINNEQELDKIQRSETGGTLSNYCMHIWYTVLPDQLLVFPPMNVLNINGKQTYSLQKQIPIDMFYKMISFHKYLSLDYGYVVVTLEERNNTIELISEYSDVRTVKFTMDNAIIVSYLRSFGISETSEEGDRIGKFEINGIYPEDIEIMRDSRIYLRFKNCDISICCIGWTHFYSGTTVEMSNLK